MGGARVLVTIGDQRHPGELGPLPPSVRVERWVSQAEPMPHTAAMVGHAGDGERGFGRPSNRCKRGRSAAAGVTALRRGWPGVCTRFVPVAGQHTSSANSTSLTYAHAATAANSGRHA
jgi:hypothetical protein